MGTDLALMTAKLYLIKTYAALKPLKWNNLKKSVVDFITEGYLYKRRDTLSTKMNGLQAACDLCTVP